MEKTTQLIEYLADLHQELKDLTFKFNFVEKQMNFLLQENADLHEQLLKKSKLSPAKTSSNSSNISLQSLYDDSFHICTAFYGNRRNPEEECLLCLGILDRK